MSDREGVRQPAGRSARPSVGDPAPPGNGSRHPFSAPGSGFYGGADRRTHLEQLRHLSQWSRRVLIVTGPRGVGKSTLYRQLSASLEPRAKAARINGALVNSGREVLNAMIQGFGLAAPADADSQLLMDLVREHAETQERSERFCVTLIDDAELLEARALDRLVELTSTAPLRVVLFGEIRLVPALERAAASRDVGWHEIRLTGFTLDDVRDYLNWRFSQQDAAGRLPFTDAQVKEIARLSEGLPGRIDQMANVLLAKIESSGQESGRRWFPALHQALLAALVVALVFVYLVWRPGDQPREPGRAVVERIDVPPPGQLPTNQATVAEQATGEPRGDAAEAGETASESRVLAQEPAGDAVESPAADAERQAGVEGETGEPIVAATADVTERPETTAAGDLSSEPAVPERSVADTRSPAPEAGARDAAWIMRQPASAYTLQLVSFSTAERAAEYLASQADPSSFARFRFQQSGRILHVVIYGSFDSRAEAEQAAAQLPASAGNVEPWVRTYGQVQERVRTALQP